MSSRLRRLIVAGSALLVLAVAALAVLARIGSNGSSTADAQVPPLAIGTELTRPPRVPDVTLVNAAGQRTSLAAWRGKWVVLAPSMTLCHEDCPMTTGALIELTNLIRRAGLGRHVVVAEATVDPWRDTPARLRAYEARFGANFQMLTGTPRAIRRLWHFFGVAYYRVPQGKPPDVDWWTHRPETFDVDHADGVFIVSPSGQERVEDIGMADVRGRLSAPLRKLLSDEGRKHLVHPQLAWSADEAFDDLGYLMNRPLSGAAAAAAIRAPSAAAAQRELAGSPHPLATIHAHHGQLIDSSPALRAELAALRGHYPVVLNAWASWCPDCADELGLLGTAAARFGRQVAFLGADFRDSASGARRLLARDPLSYPSFTVSDLRSLAAVGGMPTTIFIARDGRVVHVRTGPYQTAASLDNDIEHYALGVTG